MWVTLMFTYLDKRWVVAIYIGVLNDLEDILCTPVSYTCLSSAITNEFAAKKTVTKKKKNEQSKNL